MPQSQGLLFIILVLLVGCSYGQNYVCIMSATKSFDDCKYQCEATQRAYYNRRTGLCETKVSCPQNTVHRIYENKCVNSNQDSIIGNTHVSIPQLYQQIRIVVIHGNYLMPTFKQMCYPGFYSSKNRVQVANNTYDEYYCDVAIGEQPGKNPLTFGEFYFWKCSLSDQLIYLDALQTRQAKLYANGTLQRQPYFYLKQLTILILLYAEITFFVSVVLHHLEILKKKSKRLAVKLNLVDQEE